MSQSRQLLCPLCAVHCESNIGNLLRHIRLFHADKPNFAIECNLRGCKKRKFQNFHTYRNHIYHYHGASDEDFDFFAAVCGGTSSVDDVDDIGVDNESDMELSGSELGEVGEAPSTSSGTPQQQAIIQDTAAVWILKIRECYGLSQSSVDSIITDVESLYQVTLKGRDVIKWVGVDGVGGGEVVTLR